MYAEEKDQFRFLDNVTVEMFQRLLFVGCCRLDDSATMMMGLQQMAAATCHRPPFTATKLHPYQSIYPSM